MFRIGEFSKLSQVSVRMLRYYDEVGLLKPAYVQEETGYRLYNTAQIEQVNRIVFLRNTGFSVEEIKELIAEWSSNKVKEALERRCDEIKIHIKEQEEHLGLIKTALKDLEEEKEQLSSQVIVKSVPSYNVFSLRRQVENYFCESSIWIALGQEVTRRKLPMDERTSCFTIYHPLEEGSPYVDIEVCAVCKEPTYSEGEFSYRQVEAVERAASVMVYGPFENINGVYQKVAKWLEENSQYTLTGESRQISHRGPQNESDEMKYVTELLIVLKLK